MIRLAIVVGVLAYAGPASAGTSCEFTGSYSSFGNYDYCSVETIVPLGCPVHAVVGEGRDATAEVERSGTIVDLTGTVTRVPFTAAVSTVDVYSCDCARTTAGAALEQVTIDLVGAQVGDYIGIGSKVAVLIDGPGPCPAVEWPTSYSENIACDRCPEPEPEPEDDWDPDGPGPLGGCSAGGSPSIGLAMALGVLAVRRRRRLRS